jgi:hypothetical protein
MPPQEPATNSYPQEQGNILRGAHPAEGRK